MGADTFQLGVAKIALDVAREHGFALGGGHALIAHGIVDRPTEDVDLFTDNDGGVQAAAGLVETALRTHGYDVELVPDNSDLGEMFYGFERNMVEIEVCRDASTMRLQLVRLDRSRQPVLLDVGPVLHIDDVIGTKVAAMAARAAQRDFVDVAAALARYSREQLIDLALQADPALADEDFTEAMRFLDRLPDRVFHQWASPSEVAELRARFASWPRKPDGCAT